MYEKQEMLKDEIMLSIDAFNIWYKELFKTKNIDYWENTTDCLREKMTEIKTKISVYNKIYDEKLELQLNFGKLEVL